jgi:YfiH family protein
MKTPDWFNEIHFAFSRREDGQMSLKRAQSEEVVINRVNFFASHNIMPEKVVVPELIHGSGVAIVSRLDAGRGATDKRWIDGVDGLITNDPEIMMFTTHADCAPLLVFDPLSRTLGQAHAGWRGLASGLVESLVKGVTAFSGAKTEDLLVWIGPTVRPCCYEVGLDVANIFPQQCVVIIGNSLRLNLVEFIKMELQRLGLVPENVTDSRVCTSCDPIYSSNRRDGSSAAAMAMVSGLGRRMNCSLPASN